MSVLLCDTGPLVAVLNADDAHHEACRDLLEENAGPLLVPAPVLTEVCYLAETRLGPEAEATFLDSLAAGQLDFVDVSHVDLARRLTSSVPTPTSRSVRSTPASSLSPNDSASPR